MPGQVNKPKKLTPKEKLMAEVRKSITAKSKKPPTQESFGLKKGAGEEPEIKGINPVLAAAAAEKEKFVQAAAEKFNDKYAPIPKEQKPQIEAVFPEKLPSPDVPLRAFVNPMGTQPNARTTTTSGGANPTSSRPAAEQAQPARRIK